MHLEQLVLQSHVVLRLKTNTSTENVDQSTALLSESIDNRCSWWRQWSLEHEAEDAEHAVEVLELLCGDTIGGCGFPLDTSHHLSDQDQVDNQWRSKKRVLTNIEESVTLVRVRTKRE